MREDGRADAELRPMSAERGVSRYAEGSARLQCGSTIVHCTASVETKVPPFLRGQYSGWITAEYAMLPRATAVRTPRDISKGKISGRSSEIQRLIGRSLRAAVDLERLGEITITIDCDIIQADGGTRTASVSAGFIALYDALRSIMRTDALKAQVAAVSVGRVDGVQLLDLCYEEDCRAEVDCNVVMTSSGRYIEIQGTGEHGTFSRAELDEMMFLVDTGMERIFELQRDVLGLTAAERQRFLALRNGR